MCRQSAQRKEERTCETDSICFVGSCHYCRDHHRILTMSHRTLRESEMEDSLADVVKGALDEVVQTQDLDITDEDALMASFLSLYCKGSMPEKKEMRIQTLICRWI